MLIQRLVLLIAASGALSSITVPQDVGMANVTSSTGKTTEIIATTSASILTTKQSTTNLITSEGSAVTTSRTEISMATTLDAITTNVMTGSTSLDYTKLAVLIAASVTALIVIGAVIGLLVWNRRRRRNQKIDPIPLTMPRNDPNSQPPKTSRIRPVNENYLSVDEINIPSSMTGSSASNGNTRDSGLHDSDGYLLMAPGPISPKEPKYQNVKIKTVRPLVVNSYDNEAFTSEQSKTEKTSKKKIEQPKMEVNTNLQDPDQTGFDDNSKFDIMQSEMSTSYPEPNKTCSGGHFENVKGKKSGETPPEPDETAAVKPGAHSSNVDANKYSTQPERSHPEEYQTGSKFSSSEEAETESSQSELDETSSNDEESDITALPPLPPRALEPGFRHANHPSYDSWG